jgi:hypothetical protein
MRAGRRATGGMVSSTVTLAVHRSRTLLLLSSHGQRHRIRSHVRTAEAVRGHARLAMPQASFDPPSTSRQ